MSFGNDQFDTDILALAEDWLKRTLPDAEKQKFLLEIHDHVAKIPKDGARCKTIKLKDWTAIAEKLK